MSVLVRTILVALIGISVLEVVHFRADRQDTQETVVENR